MPGGPRPRRPERKSVSARPLVVGIESLAPPEIHREWMEGVFEAGGIEVEG